MASDVSTVNPITPALKREVKQRIYQLSQNKIAIDKAESVGYDVTEERQMNDALYDTLVKVLTEYGSGES